MLHVIVARRVRFPDIDLYTLDGFPVCVFQGADDEEGFALRVVRD